MGRLEGKVALVTGAGQGIGRAIARRYVAEGASVVLADINEDGAIATAEELGSAALGVRCDVSSRDEVEHAFDRCIEHFGAIDILVNNAGITFAAVKHFLEMDEAFWDGILATNLKGHYLCAARAAREMVERQSGVIINMSSGGGTRSHRGMVAYDAAKGGIEALTRALALDLGPYGIRVMCLVPGMMVESRESADPGPARLGGRHRAARACRARRGHGRPRGVRGVGRRRLHDGLEAVRRGWRALPAAPAPDRDVRARPVPEDRQARVSELACASASTSAARSPISASSASTGSSRSARP